MLDEKIDPSTQPGAGADAANPAVVDAAVAGAGAAPLKTEDGNLDLLGGDEGDDREVATPATWPDDWRAKLAGSDEKLAKRLERFTDPSGLLKSYTALEQKISSGEYRKALPENPNDKELAEWRKTFGVPEAPDKYEPVKVEGHEWGEQDKPLLDAFFAKAHSANLSQKQADEVLKTYTEMIQGAEQQRHESDKAWKQTNEDELRNAWGNDYRAQINVYTRVLEDPEVLPDGLGAVLATARDSAGNRIINDARVAQWLVQMGLEKYGDGALTVGNGRQTAQSRETEIMGVMRTDFERYIREGLDKELAGIRQKYRGPER